MSVQRDKYTLVLCPVYSFYVRLCVCLCVCLSVYLSVCLAVCLAVRLAASILFCCDSACPQNEEFSANAPQAPLSCDMDAPDACIRPTKPGCMCSSGYARNGTSPNSPCVPISKCRSKLYCCMPRNHVSFRTDAHLF